MFNVLWGVMCDGFEVHVRQLRNAEQQWKSALDLVYGEVKMDWKEVCRRERQLWEAVGLGIHED